MPAPTPFATPHSQMYPALYLYPLNESFVPKHISLVGGQRVKIGRQTNAKTVPGERNGYFDSKVLSRQHAEIWEETGKIFIKDVKSSNGTFINGERLSPEGMESDPWELKSDDIVEFGIDIVGDDNKILHYKVAARVFCIFNEQDLQIAHRSEQHQQQQHHQQALQPHGAPPSLQAGPSSSTINNSSFNFGANNGSGPPRRTSSGMQPGITGMGGMGGGMRAPGKSGLTFEHILNRLQGELQKSRETGTELQSLNGTMSEVHDTLGGSLPSNLPPYPHTLPPVRPLQTSDVPAREPEPEVHPSISPTALSDLQTQLHETQASLASHVDKIRELEDLRKEQESIQRDVSELRHFIHFNRQSTRSEQSDDDDDDDARSIVTVVPHELATVAEEDEEQEKEAEVGQSQESEASQPRAEKVRDVEEEAEDAERRQRQEELGRPRTPEPASLGMGSDLFTDAKHPPQYAQSAELLDALNSRLLLLSNQFESFMTLTTSLQAQHDAAQSTILNLQAKVVELEDKVKTSQTGQEEVISASISAATAVVASAFAARDAQTPAKSDTENGTLEQLMTDWKKNVDGQWSSMREEWSEERARLAKASEEWETKIKQVDSKLTALTTVSDPPLAAGPDDHQNGNLRHTLATPPSPRSLSSDSRRSSRRKRSGSARGRTGNRSRSQSPTGTNGTSASSYDGMTDSTSVTSVSQAGCDDDVLRADSPDFESDETLHDAKGAGALLGSSLIYDGFDRLLTVDAADNAVAASHAPRKRAAPIQYIHTHPIPSTAFGVLLIGVAAAVLWKVKE
ncbi:hypothetical protein PC9H_005844 [Pleurotus ostreatus]|uniref:FHA domain-containing protein n=1 Tax=Pleurotus ostreatus TaxID=5322 RepID=A0A8H7DTJ8_PLEOS|nr:uncharacterized protein PC9H_005844 [Pleurotus ostreatus]KAF7430144.1 hypothetical protein PC9H_005844 [Pleurotus ostreatus]